MEELLAFLNEHPPHVIYAVLVGVLVAVGFGFPIPEDITLITGGFLAYLGVINLPTLMVVVYVGVLAGDSVTYFIGRFWGLSILKLPPFRFIFTEKRLDRVRHYFNKYGDKTIFITRFVIGLRAATFWAAGTLRVPYTTFIVWNGLAAMISVPFFVSLGYFFGDDIEVALRWVERMESVVLSALGLAALALAAWWLKHVIVKRRRRRTKELPPPDRPTLQ